MMPLLGAAVDFVHAVLMVAWIIGLPLLFWHKYPKITMWYTIYSIVFIVVNQVSHYVFGCCILTVFAEYFWSHGTIAKPDEWFTVRFSKMIFGMTPSHLAIKRTTEFLILLFTMGAMRLLWMKRRELKCGS